MFKTKNRNQEVFFNEVPNYHLFYHLRGGMGVESNTQIINTLLLHCFNFFL